MDIGDSDVESVVALGDEAVSRNGGILTELEQAALRSATVLVAGCGSVGGSVVEPLARLGVLRFRLADPDRYDVTNLNRQACVLADVGDLKTEVLARRIHAISPTAEVRTYPTGLSLENLPEALGGVHVVFDGVDPGPSGWVKYQLHAQAAALGIPVIAGVDFGGKPVVYVFDYRRNPTPFYGKASGEAHLEGRLWDSVRWFGRTHFSADYLPVMAERMQTGEPWPQISYCVMGMGALGSRVVVDVLMNRRVRDVVTVDLHARTMTWGRAAAHQARVPIRTVRLVRMANRYASRGRPEPAPTAPRHTLPRDLVTALDGARHAPSPYNSQPWHFTVTGQDSLRLAPVPHRWPRDGSDPDGWAEALGCAREAMSYLAHGVWKPNAGGEPGQGQSWVGEFIVERLRGENVLARRGVLELRSTERGRLLRSPLDNATLRSLECGCADLGVEVEAVTDRMLLDRLAAAAADLRVAANAHTTVPGRLRAAVAARRAGRRFHDCGALVLLRARTDTVASRMDVGAAVMRTWLTLVEAGYAAQPLHGEQTSSYVRPLVAGLRASGSAGELPIAGILRAGRACSPATPQPPRLPWAAVVSHGHGSAGE